MHTYQAGSSPDALEQDPRPTGEVFPLATVAEAIWARRLLILIVMIAAGLAGFVWARFQPAEYDSTVVLKVSDIRMREAGQPMAPIGFTVLLANRALAQQLISEFQLEKRYDVTPSTLLSAIRLSEDRNASLVRARVRFEDPELATKLANRFAELAIELNRTMNQKDTAVARDLIKAQLDEAVARLQAARAAMLAFRREAQVELSKADITSVLEQRQELGDWMMTLAAEKARLAQLERDLAQQPATLSGTRSPQADADLVAAINQAAREADPPRSTSRRPDTLGQPEGALPPGITSPTDKETFPIVDAARRQSERTRADAERRAEVRRETDDRRRTDDVPPLPAGDARANPVRLLLEFQVAAARSRVAALEQRRKELSDVLRLDAPRARNLEKLYQGEEELRRRDLEVRVAEKAYADLSERYEEARLQVAARSADLQVIDPAVVPHKTASWPDASVAALTALLGGLVALGGVSLVALVRSWRLG